MTLLTMSLQAAVLIAAIIGVRALGKNSLPKATFLVLWLVAVCRLLIPFSISSNFSLYTLFPSTVMPAAQHAAPIEQNLMQAPQTEILPPTEARYNLAALEAGMTTVEAGSATVEQTVLPISPLLLAWMIGAAAITIFFIVSYVRCYREFKTSLPADNAQALAWLKAHPLRRRVQIRVSDRIASPLTYGILRPVILLPKHTNWADEQSLSYILAHEWVHIRRWDTLWKMLLAAALCVHWFNPLVWVMMVIGNRDLELSCDERVIRLFGQESVSSYALTLLGRQKEQTSFAPLVSHFSRRAVVERINAIMKYKKTSVIAIIVAVVLVMGMTTAFATSAKTGKEDNQGVVAGIFAKYPEDTFMTEAEYLAMNPDASDQVLYWDIDEFEVWMKDQKAQMDALMAQEVKYFYRGSLNGEVQEWTQGDVDAVYALWEEQLEQMKRGVRYVQGIYSTMYDTNQTIASAAEDVAVTQDAATGTITSWDLTARQTSAKSLEVYEKCEPFGVTYDAQKDELYYEGQLVRWFFDDNVPSSENWEGATHFTPKGVVDVHTVRTLLDQKIEDATVRPAGTIIGMKPDPQVVFDARTYSRELFAGGNSGEVTVTEDVATEVAAKEGKAMEAVAEEYKAIETAVAEHKLIDASEEGYRYARSEAGVSTEVSGKSDSSIYKPYVAFGVTYDAKTYRMYYNGKQVRYFEDDNMVYNSEGMGTGSITAYQADKNAGEIDVYAVRDAKHQMTGVRVATQKEFDAKTAELIANDAAIAEGLAASAG